ncbi:hypothetical protein [Halosolutus gelatinilyticus]|uniref:hypothetical protein n=1 Tax=Halosolutus gelatinilyticus TaxID=2931975 RepID=UPI001FF15670|nr:hypothetical protein [Halosolutus gelatinilyticus]
MVILVSVLACTLLLGGCLGDREYTATVSEPETGEVIDDVSVSEINSFDGTRLQLHYSIDDPKRRSYRLYVYEQENGSYEYNDQYPLDPTERMLEVFVSIPLSYADETAIQEQLRVVRGENGTVVDSVTVTVKLGES